MGSGAGALMNGAVAAARPPADVSLGKRWIKSTLSAALSASATEISRRRRPCVVYPEHGARS